MSVFWYTICGKIKSSNLYALILNCNFLVSYTIDFYSAFYLRKVAYLVCIVAGNL